MTPTHDSAENLKFPILIGDIGGTNARFALLVDAFAEPKNFPIVQTADFPNIDDAIQATVLDKTSIQPRSAVLAIAGPISGDEIELTNCHWVVRPRRLIEDLGFEDVLLVNDFEAQALAVSALPDAGREAIGPAGTPHDGARVVVGPGTGLGVAGLVKARRMWIPVAGEGGHIDLGPRSARDLAIWPYLETIGGRVSAEQILCGRGLVNLYNAIGRADGREVQPHSPASITAAAGAGDETAREAIRLFGIYLGRVAGDLALVFMARGGVFIAGGIFGHIAPYIDRAAMRAAFEDKAPHEALLRDMPLYAITLPLAALAGLATFARAPRSYGLETTNRRWTR
ncbi:glucokinase [Aureimonas ureilytica]|uniref:Glucokinase n=1 Tax=Aureimonas ureilytica TaxID=401562 RepID=A0A175RU32_9HYPH|nr:glucokinase [Aureimonas ureilytica]KTR07285.1 glucokinase [Aureimonas ureilytica]